MENFMRGQIESGDVGAYYLNDASLSGLFIQAGFVEGVIADCKKFSSLNKALEHVFCLNLEYAILLWNGIPLSLSYVSDIPELLPTFVEILNQVLPSFNTGAVPVQEYNLHSRRVSAVWKINFEEGDVVIEADWQRAPGGLEDVLNALGNTRMEKKAFCHEWKLLLEQCTRAIREGAISITSAQGRAQIQQLQEVESAINHRGCFYQY